MHLPPKEVPASELKALACYGVWLAQEARMMLRFVAGRPVSAMTEAFLEWVASELWSAGQEALLLIGDNAPWHVSARVRAWIRTHNRQVRRGEKQAVRLVVCLLPKKSPWLNPIEPRWLHGKRAVAEPERLLDPPTIMTRVYEHFRCPAWPVLSTTLS